MKLCPTVSINVQNIFLGGRTFYCRGLAPCTPPGYGPASPVFRWTFWMHASTSIVVFFQLVEVVQHSRHYEFHSCALCRECHTRSVTRGTQFSGRRNVSTMSQGFSSMHIFTRKIPFCRSKHGGAKLVSCPGPI